MNYCVDCEHLLNAPDDEGIYECDRCGRQQRLVDGDLVEIAWTPLRFARHVLTRPEDHYDDVVFLATEVVRLNEECERWHQIAIANDDSAYEAITHLNPLMLSLILFNRTLPRGKARDLARSAVQPLSQAVEALVKAHRRMSQP